MPAKAGLNRELWLNRGFLNVHLLAARAFHENLVGDGLLLLKIAQADDEGSGDFLPSHNDEQSGIGLHVFLQNHARSQLGDPERTKFGLTGVVLKAFQ